MEEFYYSKEAVMESTYVCVCWGRWCEAVRITDKFCFLECFSALSFWCVYVMERDDKEATLRYDCRITCKAK